MGVSKREEEVLAFIKNFMVERHVTPTIREIGEGIGLKSTSTVHTYFERLVHRGDIIMVSEKRYRVKGVYYKECI